MEIENGKDYKTYFMDNKVACFYASKIYWEDIEVLKIDDGRYRGYQTFFNDEEERLKGFRHYVLTNPSYHYETVTDRERLRNSEKFTKKELAKIKEKTQKIKVKCEFFKRAICCPCCHKVHYIEDYLIVKEEKKQLIEQIKKDYGPHWYSLFYYDSDNDPNYFFESIYSGWDGWDLEKYKKENPESTIYDTIYGYSYYSLDNKYCSFYPKLVCPECGCLTNEYKYRQLSIFDKFSRENSQMNAITIFDDKKKIAASALFRTYYINVDAATIAREEYRVRVTLNTETGQTYFIGPKKLNGKKMPGWHEGYIVNITYRLGSYLRYPMDCLLNASIVKRELFKLLMERNNDSIDKFKNFMHRDEFDAAMQPELYEGYDFEIKDVYDICFEDFPFTWITLYNRFPCLNGDQLMNIFPKNKADYPYNYFMKRMFKGVERSFTSSQLLDAVVKNAGLPQTKKTRKIIAADLYSAKNVLMLTRCGFKDINIIYRFLELPKQQQENFYHSIYEEDVKKVKVFVKDMIKQKGESKTFATLFNNNPKCYDICDSARMYVEFKAADMVIKDYFKDSIKKIHDRLSQDFSKIQFRNAVISYPKKASKFNMVIANEYEFNLAEDTNELVRIGQELKICVGGYRDSALSGRCRIISVKQSGKYVGCIELTSDFSRLVQAKAVYNNRLQEHKALALKEWVETLGIDAQTCCDYEHIREDDISFDTSNMYLSGYDYHQYELDDEGNVIRAGQRNQNNNREDFDWGDDDPMPFG